MTALETSSYIINAMNQAVGAMTTWTRNVVTHFIECLIVISVHDFIVLAAYTTQIK
jgi:hypothetical protein